MDMSSEDSYGCGILSPVLSGYLRLIERRHAGPRFNTIPLFLQQLSFPLALPNILWRVQHSDSQATFIQNGDLAAELADYIPTRLFELRTHLIRHLKWGYSKGGSCFISAFDDYRKALEWAKTRHRAQEKHDGQASDVRLYAIRTAHLGREVVFKVDKLLAKLRMDFLPHHDASHEYVILNRVPAKAIELFEDVNEVMMRVRSSPWRMTSMERSQISTLNSRISLQSMQNVQTVVTHYTLSQEHLARHQSEQSLRRRASRQQRESTSSLITPKWTGESGVRELYESGDEDEDADRDEDIEQWIEAQGRE